MNAWSAVLDSCPGLLCCVINLKGKLLYASGGYKAVAARILGHKCTEGSSYPPLITDIDRAFHDALTSACLGETNAIEISEHDRIWELTASPLRVSSQKIEGVVVRIMSENQVKEKNSQPVIQTDPEILEAVPFRACVVNQKGMILAANKFFSKSSKENLIGKNIIEIFKPVSNSSIMKIISQHHGSVEGRVPDLIVEENFCDALYLDENLNEKQEETSENFRVLKVHATPIKWTRAGLQQEAESVMLTFEDITEAKKAQDQLRRLLTFDKATGILNRRGIEHILLNEFGNAIQESEDLSLIMINLDNFTALNEAQGYAAGNRTIRGLTRDMKKILASYSPSVIARWGGDEFLILSHCSGAAAVAIANEIRETCLKRAYVASSAGIADLNSGNYAGVNDFIGAAYNAMIEAKNSGKNSTVLAKL